MAEHSSAVPAAMPQPAQSVAASTGSICAAMVSAGLGCFVLGLADVLADASPKIGKAFNLYNPSGPLSGETTLAVVVWLAAWFLLARSWREHLPRVNVALAAAFSLLGLGLLLMFPPIVDLLSGH